MGKLAGVRDVLVLALALCFMASRAAADVRLDWQAAEGCPDAATVTSAMHKWLDTMGTPVAAADVQLDADVEASAAGYELALELHTRSGSRSMRMFSENCDVFAQVIALQASLLITSDAATLAPQPSAADTRPARAFALRAAGFLSTSPLTGPAFGPTLTAAYVTLPLRLELTLGYVFPRQLRYETHPEVGGDLQSGFLSVRPCAAAQLGRFELSGCAGAEAGLIRGRGVGVSSTRTTVRSWFAVVTGVGLHALVTPVWSVWLGADLLTSLNRPEFYVAQLGALHRPARFGFRAALGIEVRMW